jgi:hypothetical protein
VPDDACKSWRALYAGLVKLAADLSDHIHIENNVLFPRFENEPEDGWSSRSPCPRSLRHPPQNPHKTFTHLALGFHDMGLERGEIRQVGGTGQEPEHAGARQFRIERSG